MKTLNITGRTVTINTEALSRGLTDLHNQDEQKKAALAFGMLDNELCEIMRKQLGDSIKAQYNEFNNDLFKSKIDIFINECSMEIEKGVYQYADMIV